MKVSFIGSVAMEKLLVESTKVGKWEIQRRERHTIPCLKELCGLQQHTEKGHFPAGLASWRDVPSRML